MKFIEENTIIGKQNIEPKIDISLKKCDNIKKIKLLMKK